MLLRRRTGAWPDISIVEQHPDPEDAGVLSFEIRIKPKAPASAATSLRPLHLKGEPHCLCRRFVIAKLFKSHMWRLLSLLIRMCMRRSLS